MNKVLDFHRLAMVLRWDALSNWKKYVRNTLGLAFVFSFICIFISLICEAMVMLHIMM